MAQQLRSERHWSRSRSRGRRETIGAPARSTPPLLAEAKGPWAAPSKKQLKSVVVKKVEPKGWLGGV